jgi:hypothetical protein
MDSAKHKKVMVQYGVFPQGTPVEKVVNPIYCVGRKCPTELKSSTMYRRLYGHTNIIENT